MKTEEKLSVMFEENFGEDLSFLPAIEIEVLDTAISDNIEDPHPLCISVKDLSSNPKYSKKNLNMGVSRLIIGFNSGKRMENDKRMFNYIMGANILAGINSATKKMGSLLTRKVKMYKYSNGLYFKELENAAAYEFRIVIEAKNENI